MSNSVIALPVSVEQVAVAIRQMKLPERKRLLDLVPELRQEMAETLPRTLDQARAAVERARAEVKQVLVGKSISPEEPFWGDLTISQYMNLPDETRAQLWEEWAGTDLEEIEEREV
jgi:hypothetical protein